MTLGTLYGIGVGPGDPEWMTVKAVRLLSACRHVCVPKARDLADSIALEIARPHLRPDTVVHQTTFLMTLDKALLKQSHAQAAEEILAILRGGEDCCFLTLGDPMLYSTYVYLLRELRGIEPRVTVETVPGITAFSAAAALTNFPVGEGKQPVTIVPASDDFALFRRALDCGGTVVLMKTGKRLQKVLDELEQRGLIGQAVFVSHAGQPQQKIETNLRRLRGGAENLGYLSILIIQAGPGCDADGDAGILPACDADVSSACDADVSPAPEDMGPANASGNDKDAGKMFATHAGETPATHEGGTPSPRTKELP